MQHSMPISDYSKQIFNLINMKSSRETATFVLLYGT